MMIDEDYDMRVDKVNKILWRMLMFYIEIIKSPGIAMCEWFVLAEYSKWEQEELR